MADLILEVGGDLRPLEKEIKRVSRKGINPLNEKGFKQPLGRITGQIGEFEKSLEASNARVLAFGASAGALVAVQQGFKAILDATVDVEKRLADINVILNASSGELQSFGEQLFAVARSTGQSFTDVAEAATELARQGLSVSETLQRTSDALILTRLSGMKAADSVNAITAALNSFSRAAIDSTTFVSKLAAVDAAFAVSSQDLAEAVKRVGSSAQEAGLGIDELIAAVTAAQQITARGGAVIGNSFKTIFTRIQRPRVIKELENLGIAVKGIGGTVKPAMQILQELASTYDNLSSTQKAATAELIGGVFQVNVLKAALRDLSKDYSLYGNALDISNAATDEATRRNEELNKTVAATLNKTIANLTNFGSKVGELAFGPAIKKVLGGINSAIENFDLKDPDSFGEKIGAGVLGGIGKFLGGPGIAVIGITLIKTFTRLSKQVLDAFKTISNIGRASEAQLQAQRQVSEVLAQEPNLLARVEDGTLDIADAHRRILFIIEQENAAQAEYLNIVKKISAVQGGKHFVNRRGDAPTFSGGYIPNFNKDKEAKQKELSSASYATPSTRAVKDKMPGVGTYYRNTAEKKISGKPFGLKQDFIVPPKGSEEGNAYRKQTSKMGIDVDRLAYDGYVPNFAEAATAPDKLPIKLTLPPEGYLPLPNWWPEVQSPLGDGGKINRVLENKYMPKSVLTPAGGGEVAIGDIPKKPGNKFPGESGETSNKGGPYRRGTESLVSLNPGAAEKFNQKVKEHYQTAVSNTATDVFDGRAGIPRTEPEGFGQIRGRMFEDMIQGLVGDSGAGGAGIDLAKGLSKIRDKHGDDFVNKYFTGLPTDAAEREKVLTSPTEIRGSMATAKDAPLSLKAVKDMVASNPGFGQPPMNPNMHFKAMDTMARQVVQEDGEVDLNEVNRNQEGKYDNKKNLKFLRKGYEFKIDKQDTDNLKYAGHIPNFATGLYDSDRLPSGVNRNSIIDAIVASGKPMHVFHGPAGGGKTTAAMSRYPDAELVTSLEQIDALNDFAVVSGTSRSRKSGEYSARAQSILNAASKITAVIPARSDLMERRFGRVEQGSVADDRRDPKEIESTLRAPGTDYRLYSDLKKQGKNVEVLRNEGFVPNFKNEPGSTKKKAGEALKATSKGIQTARAAVDPVELITHIGLGALDFGADELIKSGERDEAKSKAAAVIKAFYKKETGANALDYQKLLKEGFTTKSGVRYSSGYLKNARDVIAAHFQSPNYINLQNYAKNGTETVNKNANSAVVMASESVLRNNAFTKAGIQGADTFWPPLDKGGQNLRSRLRGGTGKVYLKTEGLEFLQDRVQTMSSLRLGEETTPNNLIQASKMAVNKPRYFGKNEGEPLQAFKEVGAGAEVSPGASVWKVKQKDKYPGTKTTSPSLNRVMSAGLVPNFLDMKHKKFSDGFEQEITSHDKTGNQVGQLTYDETKTGLELTYNSSFAKGAGFKQFQSLIQESAATGKPITSGSLVSQGGFGSAEDIKKFPTNFKALGSKQYFPQLRHRLVDGLQTSGNYFHESGTGEAVSFDFNSIKDLRSRVNKEDRDSYSQILSDPKLGVYIERLVSNHVTGKGDGAIKFNEGFIPKIKDWIVGKIGVFSKKNDIKPERFSSHKDFMRHTAKLMLERGELGGAEKERLEKFASGQMDFAPVLTSEDFFDVKGQEEQSEMNWGHVQGRFDRFKGMGNVGKIKNKLVKDAVNRGMSQEEAVERIEEMAAGPGQPKGSFWTEESIRTNFGGQKPNFGGLSNSVGNFLASAHSAGLQNQSGVPINEREKGFQNAIDSVTIHEFMHDMMGKGGFSDSELEPALSRWGTPLADGFNFKSTEEHYSDVVKRGGFGDEYFSTPEEILARAQQARFHLSKRDDEIGAEIKAGRKLTRAHVQAALMDAKKGVDAGPVEWDEKNIDRFLEVANRAGLSSGFVPSFAPRGARKDWVNIYEKVMAAHAEKPFKNQKELAEVADVSSSNLGTRLKKPPARLINSLGEEKLERFKKVFFEEAQGGGRGRKGIDWPEAFEKIKERHAELPFKNYTQIGSFIGAASSTVSDAANGSGTAGPAAKGSMGTKYPEFQKFFSDLDNSRELDHDWLDIFDKLKQAHEREPLSGLRNAAESVGLRPTVFYNIKSSGGMATNAKKKMGDKKFNEFISFLDSLKAKTGSTGLDWPSIVQKWKQYKSKNL